MLAPWKKSYDQPSQHIKTQRHYFADKGPSSQSRGFSSSHFQMWELDQREGWEPKNWCFWILVLEKTPAGPWDCEEIKPVHPEGNQPWIFIGRTDAEAEAPILWPPDVKRGLIGKDPNAGKDWGQEEKGITEDEMVGWYHQLNGHESELTLGDGEGQGSLAGCRTWLSNWAPTTVPYLTVTTPQNLSYTQQRKHLWFRFEFRKVRFLGSLIIWLVCGEVSGRSLRF